MNKSLIIAVFCILCLNCRGESGDCKSSYKKATEKLNQYYIDGLSSHLDTALYYASQLNTCSEYKVRGVNLKLTLYMLSKKYEAGDKYVDSLFEKDFSRPYQKILYRNSFRALLLEKQNDIAGRDSCYNEIIIEIRKYIKKNPLNKDAIADLFYTKINFEDRETVINEIDLLKSKKSYDKDFLEALKETIDSKEKK
ncbi:MAG TPA: hypothetical protein VJ602_05010 [Paludibacter sp.]|nr:hypothetical protein [Paludibacter sp.]